jgi:hypothetical protein
VGDLIQGPPTAADYLQCRQRLSLNSYERSAESVLFTIAARAKEVLASETGLKTC